MKRTQIKDALRNIKKERVSYLSIVLIAFMAVACYVGVLSAQTALQRTSNGFYDETSFRDFEIASTLLLEGSDIDAIRALDGVADAEGVYQTTAKVSDGSERITVSVQSCTERINLPVVTSGRLPETANECAVEQRLIDSGMAYAVGDTLRLTDGKEGTAEYLASDEYVITGIFLHPDHLCDVVKADPYVLVTPEAFSQDALDGCFMKAEVLIDKAPGTDRFGEGYTTTAAAVKAALETLAIERAALRDATIHDRYQGEIDENQEKLDEAAASLHDARAQLDDGAAQLAENRQKLADAEKTLSDTLAQLESGSIELSNAKAVLDRTKRQLDNAAAQLADGKATLDDTAAQLADAAQQLTDGKALLDEKKAELADARQKLDDAARQLADGKAQLEEGERKLAEAKAELDRGAAQLIDGQAKIAEGEQKLAEGAAQLSAGAQQIAEGQAKFDSATVQLASAYAEIETQKANVRQTIKSGLQTALVTGGVSAENAALAVNSIAWANSSPSANLGDPNLDATWFQLTDSIGFWLSQANYSATADSAMAQFDALFDSAIAGLDEAAITTLSNNKASVRTSMQEAVNAATAAESSYNASVGQLQQWNSYHAEYLAGAAQLSAAKAQYAQGQAQYNAGAAELAAAKKQYEEGLAKYNAGREEFEQGLAEYDRNKQKYDDGLLEYRNGEAQYADGLAKYNDGVAQYEDSLAQYNDGKAQYDEGVAQYESSLAEYESARSRYNKGVSDYQNAKKRYEDGMAAYEDGVAQYEDGMRQLAEGRETLAEKEKEYADGVAQYEDGAVQLDDARERLDALDPARWIVLDTEINGGFLQIRLNSSTINSIGTRFTALFLMIAALVIYATMGKIVDEQHKLVGVTKAFGFYNREVLAKYLIYGVSATATGVVTGALVSLVVQKNVSGGVAGVFILDEPEVVIRLDLMALVLTFGVLLTAAAVCIASRNLMRSTAIRLMQDSVPAGSKKTSSGRSILPLYQRLILRNMRTDVWRIFTTVVSVTGCCALIVIGFTMRAGLLETPVRQFDQIVHYDFDLHFEPDENGETQRELERVLTDAGADSVPTYRYFTSMDLNGDTGLAEVVVIEASAVEKLFRLSNAETGAPISVGSEGVYAISGFRDIYDISAGDAIALTDAAGRAVNAEIAALYQNYTGQLMFLTPEYYAELFGTVPDANCLMGNLNGMDFETLKTSLRDVDGFDKLERSDAVRATFDSFSLIILALVGLLTVAAGLLAAVILTNLMNIYIRQKTRELAIMRVNGFTVRETIRYVLRETYVTTALGIVLGCAAGSALGIWIMHSFQSPYNSFVAEPSPFACFAGAAITALFTLVIDLFALQKIKHLKLTDAAQ